MKRNKDKRLFWIVVAAILVLIDIISAIKIMLLRESTGWGMVWFLYVVTPTVLIGLSLVGMRINYLNERYKRSRFYTILSWVFIVPGAIIASYWTLSILGIIRGIFSIPSLSVMSIGTMLAEVIIICYLIRKIVRSKKTHPIHNGGPGPTTLRMNLQPKYLDYIKNGTKRIELRLFDQKRQGLKIGDHIEFYDDYGNEVACRITGLFHYNNFGELIENFDISLLADASVSRQELLHDLSLFYPPEKQAELGVIGIRFELR